MFIGILTFILFSHICMSANVIHVFGDSHGSFFFSNERTAIPRCEHSFFCYKTQEKDITTEWMIRWFGSRTMFRMGRDGLYALNLKDSGVRDGDCAIFAFGEIDARCHLGKQRDLQKRPIKDIIDDLVTSFIAMIEANRQNFKKLLCVIVSVMPPTDNIFNHELPYYGLLQDRADITCLLNSALQKACEQRDAYIFLDVYSDYVTSEGYLNSDLSDHVVHVHPSTNDQIKNKLLDIMHTTYNFFDA